MPTIETERLRLRMFAPEDLNDFYLIVSDPLVARYVGNGQPASWEEACVAHTSIIEHWQRHGFGRWIIADKETGRLIGYGGLRSLFGTPELVYHFAPSHWGKGLATEMAGAVLQYGFEEHPFERIVAIAKPANAASIRIMQKVGMRYEMNTRYYGIDVVQYQILRHQFVSAGSMHILDPR